MKQETSSRAKDPLIRNCEIDAVLARCDDLFAHCVVRQTKIRNAGSDIAYFQTIPMGVGSANDDAALGSQAQLLAQFVHMLLDRASGDFAAGAPDCMPDCGSGYIDTRGREKKPRHREFAWRKFKLNAVVVKGVGIAIQSKAGQFDGASYRMVLRPAQMHPQARDQLNRFARSP